MALFHHLLLSLLTIHIRTYNSKKYVDNVCHMIVTIILPLWYRTFLVDSHVSFTRFNTYSCIRPCKLNTCALKVPDV